MIEDIEDWRESQYQDFQAELGKEEKEEEVEYDLQTEFGCKECGNDKWTKIPDYENIYECTKCGLPETLEIKADIAISYPVKSIEVKTVIINPLEHEFTK